MKLTFAAIYHEKLVVDHPLIRLNRCIHVAASCLNNSMTSFEFSLTVRQSKMSSPRLVDSKRSTRMGHHHNNNYSKGTAMPRAEDMSGGDYTTTTTTTSEFQQFLNKSLRKGVHGTQ